MRHMLLLGLMLLIAACGSPERRSDGASASEARALDNAATKLEAEQLPADNSTR